MYVHSPNPWFVAVFCLDYISTSAADQRLYAYVRFETGDEMSRRAKFAFLTWIGSSVSPLKKAKVSTDKAFVKQCWPVSACLHACIYTQSSTYAV